MDVLEFKKEFVKRELGITEYYGRIHSFVDFGNANHWFEEDRQTHENVPLLLGEKLRIDLEKLSGFLGLFSNDARFYYGHDPRNKGSLGFIGKARHFFGKNRVFTKELQQVKHYLRVQDDVSQTTREIRSDKGGNFVFVPKCNFDVEISVDVIKTIETYDTLCLLSGDADFVHLARYVRAKGKKVIIIKGGYILRHLRDVAHMLINAQDIKKYIATVEKQKPG